MNRFNRTVPFAVSALVASACNLIVPGMGTGPSPGPSSSPGASASPSATPSASPAAARTPDPQQVDVCADIAETDFPVTAAAATDSAPALDTKHKENRITLATVGSAKRGFVKLNGDKEGPWDIFLTKNVAFKLTKADGAAVTLSASSSTFPDCPSLARKYTV
ncbi:MAG: hypothetical protein FJZ00_11145, partial [Candidatus Sericytochromatia bacterium]|nr:hypothetical protein [Candidatus Tanganyikabacteria bacterium]